MTGAKAARYTEVAANLTYTCWQMYARMPTGGRPASSHPRACHFPLVLCVSTRVKLNPVTHKIFCLALCARSAGAGCMGACVRADNNQRSQTYPRVCPLRGKGVM